MRDDEWYYADRAGGERVGPVTGDALRGMLSLGALPGDVLVWRDGMVAWSPARTVGDLAAAAGAAAPGHAGTLPYVHGTIGGPPPAPLGYYAGFGEVRYAGFWIRFLAAFVDGMLTAIGGFVVGAVLGLGLAALLRAAGASQQSVELTSGIAAQVAGYVIAWLYEALLTSSSYQGTLMKYALGLKVTDLQGSRISFGRATGRHFAKFISGLLLLIGYIMAAFTERRQALHDMMASTVVVYR